MSGMVGSDLLVTTSLTQLCLVHSLTNVLDHLNECAAADSTSAQVLTLSSATWWLWRAKVEDFQSDG